MALSAAVLAHREAHFLLRVMCTELMNNFLQKAGDTKAANDVDALLARCQAGQNREDASIEVNHTASTIVSPVNQWLL